jgi:beta-glucanase (GH16 family)
MNLARNVRVSLFACWAATSSAEWALTWEDNFDGDSLDSTHWEVKHNASHCCPQEPQLYVKENIDVSGGVLTITTRNDATLGPGGEVWNYTSGWVDTKGLFDQKLGRWEVRFKHVKTQLVLLFEIFL